MVTHLEGFYPDDFKAHHFNYPINRCDEVAQVSVFISVVSVILFGLSRRTGEFILGVVSIILTLTFKLLGKSVETLRDHILAQIPTNMNTALQRFNLVTRTTTYAVCPHCNAIFKPLGMSPDKPMYPTCCTSQPLPGGDLCNAPLLHDLDDGHRTPIKSFVYHHFHDYVASLLAKPGFEDLLDKPCDNVMKDIHGPAPSILKDVWDAEFLRTFEGPRAGALFVDRQGEGHLLFSLNVDFFNIEGNRQRNATTSCGIISCACLNLPLDICYKPENMYLAGIIPGPTEPSGDQLNHFLEPLIDELVDSWERGVQFSHTASQRDRITRSAIACVVCDLPAARKSAQFAGVSSHFYCSACHCVHTSTLGRTDVDSECWQFRDKVELRDYTYQYRDAKSLKEWNKLFSSHGVRWSPLWRLPYWDPARQLVVDSMHCLLEGLAQAHFREFLGLTTAFAMKAQSEVDLRPAFSHTFRSLDTPEAMTLSKHDRTHTNSIQTLLTSAVDCCTEEDDRLHVAEYIARLETKLMNKNCAALRFVAEGLQLEPLRREDTTSITQKVVGGKIRKIHWVNALVEWVWLLHTSLFGPISLGVPYSVGRSRCLRAL